MPGVMLCPKRSDEHRADLDSSRPGTAMTDFAIALAALNEMKAAGVLRDYAVSGAMALVFWTEPVATYDLDVLVWLPASEGPIVSLSGIYGWLAARGWDAHAEHVLIAGVPVQFLPAHDALADEALKTAVTLDYSDVPVRVVRPEYLVALYLEPQARTAKRRERAAALREGEGFDHERLQDIMTRFHLTW